MSSINRAQRSELITMIVALQMYDNLLTLQTFRQKNSKNL